MPEFGRRMNRLEPNVQVNVTNDAWFGQSAEPMLHLALSIPRAVEQRVYQIRSTNTGISAVIDPVGRVVARTSIRDAETLLFDVPLAPASGTPYMVLGNWPAWLAGAWLLLAATMARRNRARARSSPSPQERLGPGSSSVAAP